MEMEHSKQNVDPQRPHGEAQPWHAARSQKLHSTRRASTATLVQAEQTVAGAELEEQAGAEGPPARWGALIRRWKVRAARKSSSTRSCLACGGEYGKFRSSRSRLDTAGFL